MTRIGLVGKIDPARIDRDGPAIAPSGARRRGLRCPKFRKKLVGRPARPICRAPWNPIEAGEKAARHAPTATIRRADASVARAKRVNPAKRVDLM
jgi:hypothetical protein